MTVLDFIQLLCQFDYLFFKQEEGVVDITANSIHPGAISTNLFRHSSIVNGIYIYIYTFLAI